MEIIDNINKTVKQDLQVGIHKGSKAVLMKQTVFLLLK